ncbi:hypothetical protein, partial [Haloquadratum walsbyi]|uniref:hypothetical protein n=1 Tax=Haloquadratum walsbyi TaxID=293091 RepID=UPI0023F25671
NAIAAPGNGSHQSVLRYKLMFTSRSSISGTGHNRNSILDAGWTTNISNTLCVITPTASVAKIRRRASGTIVKVPNH